MVLAQTTHTRPGIKVFSWNVYVFFFFSRIECLSFYEGECNKSTGRENKTGIYIGWMTGEEHESGW